MLEVHNLNRKYNMFTAVDDVSFSITPGEIVGLLGHNGAGKTTILKILSGYLEPNAGSVLINGLALSEHRKLLQQKIGYLPENLPVYPDLSVGDYLDFAADLKGLIGAQKQAEIKRVLTATHIADKLLAPIGTLSRGYKQRVGVAQALLGQPQLLILDEPTNGLDPSQTQQMRDLIRAIARDATVILSTHIMQEVDALCDRVLMVRAGRLIIDAKLTELRRSRCLQLLTNIDQPGLQLLCRDLAGIEHIQLIKADNQQFLLRLQLNAAADINQQAAQLAKALVHAGADIYCLRAETRDLETLFSDNTEWGSQRHAA